MAKIKKSLFVFCLFFYLCILSVPVHAETVYTESTIDVIAVDEQTVTLYAEPAESADGESVTVSSNDITVYSSSVVYDEGTISTTYLEIARGLIKYVPFGQDYVFARTGQYEYLFAVGDFEEGFSGSAEIWKITTGNYSSNYTFTHYTDSSFSLSVGSGLIYSSVSPYPSLEGVNFSYALVFVSAFALCMFGVWSIVRFVPHFLR